MTVDFIILLSDINESVADYASHPPLNFITDKNVFRGPYRYICKIYSWTAKKPVSDKATISFSTSVF